MRSTIAEGGKNNSNVNCRFVFPILCELNVTEKKAKTKKSLSQSGVQVKKIERLLKGRLLEIGRTAVATLDILWR